MRVRDIAWIGIWRFAMQPALMLNWATGFRYTIWRGDYYRGERFLLMPRRGGLCILDGEHVSRFDSIPDFMVGIMDRVEGSVIRLGGVDDDLRQWRLGMERCDELLAPTGW